MVDLLVSSGLKKVGYEYFVIDGEPLTLEICPAVVHVECPLHTDTVQQDEGLMCAKMPGPIWQGMMMAASAPTASDSLQASSCSPPQNAMAVLWTS